ncbi:MAG: ligand-binding sensor domain-containing protein [Ilyomonas sp.]
MKKAFILLFILPLSCVCIGQNLQPKELHFNHLSIKDGLPEAWVNASLQDKEGYIWIGTQAGLVRYDGYTTKLYKFNLDDPIHSLINVIYEDHAGKLWIGVSYEGLYQYDRAADTFVNYMHHQRDPYSDYAIVGIHDDRNGNLWMIWANFNYTKGNITLFDTKKHQLKSFSNLHKRNQNINASLFLPNLFEDSKGRIWVGSNNGIYQYDSAGNKFIPHFATADSAQQKSMVPQQEDAGHPGVFWMNVWNTKSGKGEGALRYNTNDNTFKTYRHVSKDSTSLSSDSVTVIKKDSQGRLWFGTANGLSVFEASSERFINYTLKEKKANIYDNVVFMLEEDKAGNFWCAGFNLLFFDTKTKTLTRYKANEKEDDALSVANFKNLLLDRSGTIWIGTDHGLYWPNSKRSKFIVYKNNPGQPHHFPGVGGASFAERKDGTFWVWSSHGLYHWYPSSDSFTVVKGLKAEGENFTVSSTFIEQDDILWCGTWNNGLISYNLKTGAIRNFKNNKNDSTSLSNDFVYPVYIDHSGTIWIGTFGGGLCSFDKQTNTFKRYPFIVNHTNTPNNNALDDDEVLSIYEDKQGTLWVGTQNGGLNRFNRQTGTFTSYQNQIPGFTDVTAIFEDSKGHLWAGTYLSGLFLFDRKTNTAKKFTEKDGLLYDGILAINEDNSNNLWITSLRGISILNIQTNKISHLGTVNGLPEEPEQFNRTFFKTSQGQFLMPFNNGFVSFYPDQLKPDTSLPVVHIESIEFIKPQTRGNKQIDSIIRSYDKKEIKLRYNENRITFNYVALQYQNSALNQYAYKLEGYDKDWIQAGTQRKVTYTNLPPHKYIFHVKAANSDGVWNRQEQTLTVIILPPWWETWWFRIASVIAMVAVVYAIVQNHSRNLKKQNLQLEEKVMHRTKDLKQSLEHLKSTQAQLIQSEKMASLGELTAGIAHEIQNPLNFVNNFSEVNVELIEELKSEKSKEKNENGELEDEILNDIEHNLQKILQHGKRADAIVKGMLQHSRASTGKKESTDINALADEYLRLSYHGMRAKDKSFNAEIKTSFDTSIGKINIAPQDIGRVLLNLFNNAFYAVSERQRVQAVGYEPTVSISTKSTWW